MKTRLMIRGCLFTAALLLALLAGCAGSGVPMPSTPQPDAPRSRFTPREPLTPQQRYALRKRFSNTLPAQAIAALERMGAPTLAANPPRSGKSASVALPHYFNAYDPYLVGGAGYLQNSPDVTYETDPFPFASMSPAGPAFPNNFSYIVYRVDDIVGQDPLSLWMEFALGSPADFGVAVYNWAYGGMGRWEGVFFGPAFGPSHTVDLGGVAGADYTNANDDMAIMIFCLTPSTVSLNLLGVLDVAVDPEPPFADLFATPSSGQAPLTVTLDAGGSWDPDGGTIVGYRFDPLGDGNWIDNGGISTYDYEYTVPGPYQPKVEVTDDDGLTGVWQTTVIISPESYDEEEDNDDAASANALPPIPFANFSGSLGPDGPEDGDSEDFFTFDASAGDQVNFTVFHALSWGVELELRESTGGTLMWGGGGGSPANLQYEFSGFESGPFYLIVRTFDETTDYYLSCGDSFPPNYSEFEDNDSVDQANDIWQLTYNAAVSDWVGSLGAGHEYDNDGDNTDWLYFDWAGFGSLPVGAMVDLSVTYDSGTGNVGMTLLDNDGDVLANSATGDGQEDISHTIAAGDNGPYYIHLTSSSGYSLYTFAGSYTIVNPGFDEQENNDSRFEANALPMLPFSTFTGNIGMGGTYDNDTSDYFSFDATAGDLLSFIVTPDNPGSMLAADVFDSNWNTIGGAARDPNTGVLTITALIGADAVAPYYLQLSNWWWEFDPPATDYNIEGGPGSYSEVEDNDSHAQANQLPPDQTQFFIGSLGTGGGGEYDGDNTDIVKFEADAGTEVSFYLQYDKMTLGGLILDLYDSEGNIIYTAVDGDFDGTVDLYYLTGAADISPLYLHIACSSGYSDYTFSGNYYGGGGPEG